MDSRGVVELPFKLVVSAVLMCAVLGMGYHSLEVYSLGSTRNSAALAYSAVHDTLEVLRDMNVNSSREVHVSLSDTGMHRITDFTIGCGRNHTGPECSTVRYSIDGDRTYVRELPGPVRSQDPQPLRLSTGEHTLILLKELDGYRIWKKST